MTSLVDVRKAAQALKTKVILKKQQTLLSSIDQLCSNLTLLELSSPSSNSLDKLCFLFRKPLIPLYKSFTAAACRFASTLFRFIHDEKVVKSEDQQAVVSWQRVLNAIISGVVDYLEDPVVTTSTKSIVASSFYPLLCRIYFLPKAPQKETDIVLACTIYLLLCETAIGHPENQRSLRNVHLEGGKLLSVALSRSKAYLAIEALLELLANLMPTGYNSTDFLDKVFDADLFSSHKELKSLMCAAPKGDWDQISGQIYQVLAAMEISYPQPFEIIGSSVKDQASPVGLIYIDEKGLTSNIEEDGGYDTFHVPFLIIEKIRYASYEQSPTATTFTFSLSAMPTIGKTVAEKQKVTWTLDIDRSKLQTFVKALRARNLGNLFDRNERKLSKLEEELTLEVQPSQLSLLEKAQQFCDFPSETALPPSPVIPVESLPGAAKPDVTLPKPNKTVQHPDLESDAVSESCTSKPYPALPHAGKGVKRAASTSLESPELKRKRGETLASAKPTKNDHDGKDKVASPVFSKSPKANKRYGKKLRTSSPAPSVGNKRELSDLSDYEEIPAPPPKKAAKKAQELKEAKGKKAAMNGKGGKKTVVTSAKARPKTESEKRAVKTSKENVREKKEHEKSPEETERYPRRSARVKEQPKVDYEDHSKETTESKDSQPDDKSPKFAEQRVNPIVEDHQTTTHASASEDVMEESEPVYQEFVVPLKIESSDNAPELPPAVDKTMIDLTLDDTPPLKSTARKVRQLKRASSNATEKSDHKSKVPSKPVVITIDDDDDGDGTVVHEERLPWSPHLLAEKAKPQSSKVQAKEKTLAQPLQVQSSKLKYGIETPSERPRPKPKPSLKLPVFTTPKAQDSTRRSPSSLRAPTPPAPVWNPDPRPVKKQQETLLAPRLSRSGANASLGSNPATSRATAALTFTPYIKKDPLASHNAHCQEALDLPKNVKLAREPATPTKQTTVLIPIRPSPPSINLVGVVTPIKRPAVEDRVLPSNRIEAPKQFEPFDLSAVYEEEPLRKRPRPSDFASSKPTVEEQGTIAPSRLKAIHELPYRTLKNTGRSADIVDVLNDIQEVLVSKITKRMVGVKKEVRMARDQILHDAAGELEQMRIESAQCFNTLFDLETEYSTYSREVSERLEELHTMNVLIGKKLGETLEYHDRNTASKMFPRALPGLPSSLLNLSL